MSRKFLLAGLTVAALSLSVPSFADTYVFAFTSSNTPGSLIITTTGAGAGNHAATNQGYYNDAGASETLFNNSENYFAGDQAGIGRSFNNFFVFDLSGISGTITGASLSLYNPTAATDGGDGFFSDVSNAALFSLFDVTTSIAKLEATNSTSTDIFTDLGSGTAYGSTTVTSADNGTNVVVRLNADALAALNAAEGGNFAIGGTVSPATVGTSPVPEPSSLFLLGPAMAGLGWVRRRMTRA